jgi:hypothetical protein
MLIDLSKCDEFMIFPNQCVALRGHHNLGNQLVFQCENIITQSQINFQDPFENQDEIQKIKDSKKESVVIMVFAGPYTTQDSLTFTPLCYLPLF